MCDIYTRAHSDWHSYPCGRAGKYELEVTARKTGGQTILVCGQHKRMLERGKLLEIKGMEFVRAEKTELGQAEDDLSNAEWSVTSAQGDVAYIKQRLGALVYNDLDNVLLLMEGNDDFTLIINALHEAVGAKAQLIVSERALQKQKEKVARLKNSARG